MATIRNRGQYQWQAIVRKTNSATGKLHSESQTFISKKEAQDWARKLEADLSRGVYNDTRDSAKTALRDLVDRYMEEVSPLKKGGKQEIVRLKKWKEHEVADRKLTLIKPADFAAYISDRRKDGKAEQTIKLEIIAISNVFKVARRDWGYNIANPLQDISKPKGAGRRDMRLLPKHQPKVFAELAKCRNPHYPVICELAVETGLRQGELFNLSAADLHLKNPPHLIVREGKDTSGKTQGKERVVPLSARAVALLKALPRSTDKTERIFQVGRSTSRDGLSRAFAKAAKDAGHPGLRFHDLRHEAASRMAPHFSMHELMKIMGWDTASMVLRYYNPTASELHQKLQKMQISR